jgi:hypothetical protein
MTRSEYVKRALDLYNSGKISEDTYDAMMLNIDYFVDDDEEIWEAIDVYGNHYEFENEGDAYKFCYDYIEKALCDDPEELNLALDELVNHNEAIDLIGYRLKEEEDAE